MKRIFLVCLIWLITCGFQGFYWTTIEDVQHEQTYREVVDFKMVEIPLLDEDGKDTGKTKWVKRNVYETKTDRWTVTQPVLDSQVPDWRVVGEFQGKKIVHILGHEERDKIAIAKLRKDLRFLGRDLASIKNPLILKVLLHSAWYTGELDQDGNKIRRRGNMAEWIEAGKPSRIFPVQVFDHYDYIKGIVKGPDGEDVEITKKKAIFRTELQEAPWSPPHMWIGHEVVMPDEGRLNQLTN